MRLVATNVCNESCTQPKNEKSCSTQLADARMQRYPHFQPLAAEPQQAMDIFLVRPRKQQKSYHKTIENFPRLFHAREDLDKLLSVMVSHPKKNSRAMAILPMMQNAVGARSFVDYNSGTSNCGPTMRCRTLLVQKHETNPADAQEFYTKVIGHQFCRSQN